MFILKTTRRFSAMKIMSPMMIRMMSSQALEAVTNHCFISKEEFGKIFYECDENDKVIFLDVREGGKRINTQLPDCNEKIMLNKISIPLFDLMEYKLEKIEEYRDTHTIFCYSRSGNYANVASKYLKYYGYNAKTVDMNVKEFVQTMCYQ